MHNFLLFGKSAVEHAVTDGEKLFRDFPSRGVCCQARRSSHAVDLHAKWSEHVWTEPAAALLGCHVMLYLLHETVGYGND